MKLKQKAFQELVQLIEIKENKEKKVSHPGIEPACHNKNSVCMGRNRPTPKPLGYRAIDITERYQLYSTRDPDKLIRQNNNENFCKITTICLLETK